MAKDRLPFRVVSPQQVSSSARLLSRPSSFEASISTSTINPIGPDGLILQVHPRPSAGSAWVAHLVTLAVRRRVGSVDCQSDGDDSIPYAPVRACSTNLTTKTSDRTLLTVRRACQVPLPNKFSCAAYVWMRCPMIQSLVLNSGLCLYHPRPHPALLPAHHLQTSNPVHPNPSILKPHVLTTHFLFLFSSTQAERPHLLGWSLEPAPSLLFARSPRLSPDDFVLFPLANSSSFQARETQVLPWEYVASVPES